MRKNLIRIAVLAVMTVSITSCVKDDDTQLAPFTPLVFLEDFEDVQDGTELNIPGFTNFAETGTLHWKEELFDGNGYTEFIANDTSTEPTVTWLITPAIDLGTTAKMLSFRSAQHHLAQEGNKLEVFIAADYNGTDIGAATWVSLEATLPTIYTDWYKFIYSGGIDLSGYTGSIHVAFKISMADASSGAAYFVDNIKIY